MIEETVVSYQWGDDLSYIGVYEFPMPPSGIPHIPPRTTLTPPPVAPEGYEAAMNLTTGEWFIRPEDLSWMVGAQNFAPGV